MQESDIKKIYITKFIILFIFFTMFQFLISDQPSFRWIYVRYQIIPTIAIACLFHFFNPNFYGFLAYFIPFFFTLIAIPLMFKSVTTTPISSSLSWEEIHFSTAWLVVFLTAHVLALLYFRRTKLTAGLFTFLQVAAISPYALVLGYALLSHASFNADAMIAIYQTNMEEALKYAFGLASPVYYCIFIILFFILAKSLYLLNLRIQTIPVHLVGTKTRIVLWCMLLIFSYYSSEKVYPCYIKNVIAQSQGYLDALKKYEELHADDMRRFENLSVDASDDGTYILVIGESHSRDHMSAYGYKRATTPWVDQMKTNERFLLFDRAYSSHVLTVKCIMSALTESSQYNGKRFQESLSLIDLAKAAGYETIWISNQSKYGGYDTPTTIMANAADEQIWLKTNISSKTNVFDGQMSEHLARFDDGKKKLIIFHFYGSHSYYSDRYPKEFDRFTEKNVLTESFFGKWENTADFDNTDTYDNSILYNDYAMSQVVAAAEKLSNFKALLYFSDHAEETERNYQHNAGNFTFDMARIPMYVYVSPIYAKQYATTVQILKDRKKTYFTNDMVYDTMAGIMQLQTNRFTPSQNFAAPTYNIQPEELRTLYGEKRIVDDPNFYD